MMLDADVFAAQRRALQRIAPVIDADMTGARSIGEMATRLLAAAPERFAVAGLSLGGIVALELWRRARERITHFALLDTTPHAETAERALRRADEIAIAERGGLRELLTESFKPRYLAQRHRRNRALLRRILDMGLRAGPSVFRDQSLALRDRPDSRATLADIDCPSLVLCGREDELCPPAWHADMALAMPRADLVVLADCGHLAPLEAPHAVSQALLRLLRRPM
jgi:pimeloyl-ACP methyl ester carboxylesterase